MKEKRTNPRWRAALIALLAVIALLMTAAVAGVVYVRSVGDIFPGVRVDGIDLGGRSLEQVMDTLRSHGYESLGDAAVTVELPVNVSLTVRADEVCTETPVSQIALMVYERCKGGSALANALTYLRCRLGGLDISSESALQVDADAVRARVDAAALEVRAALRSADLKLGEDTLSLIKGGSGVTVDVEALSARIVQAFEARDYNTIRYTAELPADSAPDMEQIYDSVYAEAADAYYSEEHEIVPEVLGIRFDVAEARRLWDAAAYGDEVRIPLILTEPEVTAEQLEELLFRDKLSTKTTTLKGSSESRVSNVKKAAESIDGIILMPGEEFSYNPALGQRTAANGYLRAAAYSDGEVVQEYGGGICQVSSTLYYCCLYANLQITSRTCHYFPVAYVPAGMDATVSWGGPEYKFVNSREYPVKITAFVEDNSVTVELWGTDTDGSYVEMKYETSLVYDTEYTDVAVGYRARTYRSVFDADGKLLSRKPESNSYYHYHAEDIKWPEPEPSETPQPEEPPAPTEPTPTPEQPTVTEPPLPDLPVDPN